MDRKRFPFPQRVPGLRVSHHCHGSDLRKQRRTHLGTWNSHYIAYRRAGCDLENAAPGRLASCRPGMVYVGGTDNGRWIPELLNDTSGGDQHIIVTQNGLADAQYLEYVTEQYGGRLATLTPEDSQRAFAEYAADAQAPLQHDQQFPNEPKQVLAGENISMIDGKIQVSGKTAVMAINEELLQPLMQKNSVSRAQGFAVSGALAH